ncbi:MAG: GTP pyrophosphokinase [Fusobacteriaceae bacterium]|nr:GTP pyrophosphokinase [Fusobacteriaceae bacterium]
MVSLDRKKFFEKYLISDEYFKETGLDWNMLVEIYDDYKSIVPKLDIDSQHIVLKLIDAEAVHSVRRRVKNPEHLIEKIIRKGKKYLEKGLSKDNYKEIITDLIGIRVLHLFKDDWLTIHNEITHLWEVKETPQVNIRKGDNDGVDFEKIVEEAGCELIIRKYGYRSVHYLIGTPLNKNEEIKVEIQVRTVFEEAWSEIDHIIRYPYDTQNDMLGEYLAMFNRIVGSADEMGSFIQKLKGELKSCNKLVKSKRSTTNINEKEL